MGLAGCTSPQGPDEVVWAEPGPQMPSDRVPVGLLPVHAVVDRSLTPSQPDYVDLYANEISSSPLAVFQLRVLLTEQGAALADALRERNPDIVILGVLQVLSRPDYWNHPYQRQQFPLSAELFDLLASSTARTTTGDVPLMWSDAPMITPIRNGELDVGLQERLLTAIVAHAARYPRAFDGIMHDYMSGKPWIWPDPVEAGIGEADLDGDGIGISRDPREATLWVDWQARLIDRLQELFGPGLIQIANGNLPIINAAVAQRLAGIWYQHFPTTVWNYTDRRGLDMAIEHAQPGYHTPRRGRLWSIYAPETASREGRVDFRRHTSFLTGQFYVYKQSTPEQIVTRDPVLEHLGAPTGDLHIGDLEDGSTIYERAFQDGIVRILMGASDYAIALEIERP